VIARATHLDYKMIEKKILCWRLDSD
jgi:hypothetical protein